MTEDTGVSVSGASVLLEEPAHPYYVVAPRYIRTSAGIRVLHLVCHALNRMGANAYMVIMPPHPAESSVHPDLLTPVLTARIVNHHFRRGRVPIVIYPETIVGNPLQAPMVVRYFLNFPGLLAKVDGVNPSEYAISFSQEIAAMVPGNRQILFIPTSDPTFFSPGEPQRRSGACYYADKFTYVHGGKTLPLTAGLVEIVRDQPGAQTPEQIRNLFRTCEVFYCYVNSALAIEAVLCHCPAVFLPNPYLRMQIGRDQLGHDGYAWGADSAEILRAKETVAQGRKNYLRLFSGAEVGLRQFLVETQAAAAAVPYVHPIALPELPMSAGLRRLAWAIEKTRYHWQYTGVRGTSRLILKRLWRRSSTDDKEQA